MPEKTSPKSDFVPNEDKQLDISIAGVTFRRYPLQTKKVVAEDNLTKVVVGEVSDFFGALPKQQDHMLFLGKPWYLFVSEKIVAITQGRSFFIKDMKPGFWAKLLSHFVIKTSYGIGLGSPWTMQLAIQEAGLPRILFASVASVLGKLVGKKGVFYNLAGSNVRAIDGPTSYSVYPSNVSAKLPPKDPDLVAEQLDGEVRKVLSENVTKNFLGVVIMDANDIGRNVLGQNTDTSDPELEAMFADNPLGQGHECTPLCVVFESSKSS